MNATTLFGFASVGTMLLAYAFEQRSPLWVLIFAFACLSSATYGLLAGTIPFVVVEGIWAGVAFHRWWKADRYTKSSRIMDPTGIIVDGISAEAELAILRELEALGILVTCETCGQCDRSGARCIATARGNSICGKSLMKVE